MVLHLAFWANSSTDLPLGLNLKDLAPNNPPRKKPHDVSNVSKMQAVGDADGCGRCWQCEGAMLRVSDACLNDTDGVEGDAGNVKVAPMPQKVCNQPLSLYHSPYINIYIYIYISAYYLASILGNIHFRIS